MESTLDHYVPGQDFATLVVRPGRDDSFSVQGYANRGEITIQLPLYAHEARELISILTPLAEEPDEILSIGERS